MVLADVLQRERPPGFGRLRGPFWILQIFRQVLYVNKIVLRDQRCAGDDILEFPDVPGPGVL